jgi:APA family basic amino acid/polyamine antiporter
MDNHNPPALPRSLNLLDATMINVGIMLASGIFLVPSTIASRLDSSLLNLAVWIIAGLFSVLGALTIAELGALFPEAGGMFVYLKEAYSPLCGFLYGWSLFLVIQTGSIAAVAVAFASYFGYFIHLSPVMVKMVAVGTILVLSLINYFGVRWGAWTQNVFTLAKVGAIGVLLLLSFLSGAGTLSNFKPLLPAGSAQSWIGSFGLALIAALWCYDGWIQACYVGGEIKNPGRNLPLSMISSTLIILVIYLSINFAYIFVLSVAGVARSERVAADMAKGVLVSYGAGLIALLVMLSTFGSDNGMILAGARVYYAMAKEKLFFLKVATIHPKFFTPSFALGFQAVWSCLLVFSGTYEQLFTYVIFVEFLFYGMCAAAVLALRRNRAGLFRPYKTWGYPAVPILFILFTAFLLINTICTNLRDSAIGSVLLLSGLPAYWFWRKKGRPNDE